MGYFANSGEWDEFEKRQCYGCVHYDPAQKDACPVEELHSDWNDQQGRSISLEDDTPESIRADALKRLIDTDRTGAQVCRMRMDLSEKGVTPDLLSDLGREARDYERMRRREQMVYPALVKLRRERMGATG